eukprot:gene23263-30491_t
MRNREEYHSSFIRDLVATSGKETHRARGRCLIQDVDASLSHPAGAPATGPWGPSVLDKAPTLKVAISQGESFPLDPPPPPLINPRTRFHDAGSGPRGVGLDLPRASHELRNIPVSCVAISVTSRDSGRAVLSTNEPWSSCGSSNSTA